ncbi:hypothetical protein [Allopontixanthobacter sediminis]|uniref:Uncharacterized protein n=1 Tax=Allopontixanthobacter sediminis TaxID=1689985 RepID=A0A845B2N3_9SPHN|nr:hypothetical protein [Allopontixanthobacter sediminis]MXP44446.1 hypothetical protein [Allopontixanthobacter sediminis]
MRALFPLLALGSSILLPGCIARTALDVVTAPVKVVSKAADLATTSQSEADEKRGREIRKREEQLGKLDRKREKLADKCDDGDSSACRDLEAVEAEMRALSPAVPVEPYRR